MHSYAARRRKAGTSTYRSRIGTVSGGDDALLNAPVSLIKVSAAVQGTVGSVVESDALDHVELVEMAKKILHNIAAERVKVGESVEKLRRWSRDTPLLVSARLAGRDRP